MFILYSGNRALSLSNNIWWQKTFITFFTRMWICVTYVESWTVGVSLRWFALSGNLSLTWFCSTRQLVFLELDPVIIKRKKMLMMMINFHQTQSFCCFNKPLSFTRCPTVHIKEGNIWQIVVVAMQMCSLYRTLLKLNISQPLCTAELTPFGIYRGHLGLSSDTKCESVGIAVFFGGFKDILTGQFSFSGSQEDMDPCSWCCRTISIITWFK